MSLASFVPPLLISMLSEGPVPEAGRAVDREAALLFIDIAGFTALADLVTARFGECGAERLQGILNACFVPIVETVNSAGGQVLAFPGDAALCLWLVAPDASAGGLRDAVRRAVRCAADLHERLAAVRTIDDTALQVRTVVAAGRIRAIVAGGLDGHWHLIVAGTAVRQLDAIGAANTGEVVVSPDARLLCEAGPDEGSADKAGDGRGQAPGDGGAPPELIEAAADRALAPLIPASVRARLDSGQGGWLSEFRIVTVMFVVFPDPAVIDQPQRAVRTVQEVVQRFDGDLNQVVVDEKGLTAVVAFGLFQRTHEDDAARAVGAALELIATAGDVSPHIGIATGRVFTGLRGAPARSEFAVIGPAVVLAARLAARADDAMCDAVTCERAKKRFRFEETSPIALKGKGLVRNVWRPRAAATMVAGGGADRAGPVGRHDELAQIERCLDAFIERHEGGLMTVTGEPGIGKSTLAAAVRQAAARRGLESAVGGGDSIQSSTTLHAWRPVFQALLAAANAAASAALPERLALLVGAAETAWFPLLNPVLPEPLAETEQTASLTAESRARAARLLLGSLVGALTARRPFLVIIEDAHWIDSSSWELIEEVVARVPHVLLLVTRRSRAGGDPRSGAGGAPHVRLAIELATMSASDIAAIVAGRLAVERLSPDLTAWIVARCEGNPFFAQELALMLVERGAAVIESGAATFTPLVPQQNLASLPTTVHSVLAARIDRLSATEQLTLKVATVLGRQFDAETVAAITPVREPAGVLAWRLRQITATGLLAESPGHAGGFVFSHAFVQEVAYGLLAFEQRRLLHRGAAEQIERAEREPAPTLLPLLAHHWEQGDVPAKAMFYLERAGEHALRSASSNAEAERFLRRLIALAGESQAAGANDVDAPPDARARWERMLSQAVARQGRHADAVAHVERGLSLLGRSVPRDGWSSRLEAGWGIAARLLSSPPRLVASRRDDAARLEAMRLYDSLIQLLYVVDTDGQRGNAALLSAVALLRSVRLGEQKGLCPELSSSYAVVANMVAMFRRPRLAIEYADRARSVATEVNDKQALFRALTIGQLPAFIFGKWRDAEALLTEGIALGATLRNLHESLVAECTLAYIDFHRGDLEPAAARFDAVARRGREADLLLPELWGIVGVAEVRLRQGRVAEAIDGANVCLRLANEHRSTDHNSRFQAHGVLASAWAYQGNRDRAVAQVEPAMAAAAAGAHLSYAGLAGFLGVSDALLFDAASGTSGADARLQRWLRRFRGAAFFRPIFEPSCLQTRGALNRHRGRRWLARRQFRKSVQLAERLAMPYEMERGRQAIAELESAT